MKHEFWHNCWETGKTGWQQRRVNTRLQRYWSQLDVLAGSTVFVPLCGDSLDMLWLRDQGYSVLGSELSEIAVERFFTDNGITATVSNRFVSVTSEGQDVSVYEGDGVSILCGDFFSLGPEHLADVSAVYDRAATVALPPDLRKRYVEQLAQNLTADTSMLLISMDYDQQKMKGPPFSVSDDVIQDLYSKDFDINRLGTASGPDILGNLAERGLDTLVENVYQLKKTS